MNKLLSFLNLGVFQLANKIICTYTKHCWFLIRRRKSPATQGVRKLVDQTLKSALKNNNFSIKHYFISEEGPNVRVFCKLFVNGWTVKMVNPVYFTSTDSSAWETLLFQKLCLQIRFHGFMWPPNLGTPCMGNIETVYFIIFFFSNLTPTHIELRNIFGQTWWKRKNHCCLLVLLYQIAH